MAARKRARRKAARRKRAPGRPKVEIDYELLETLAAMRCTDEELAGAFKCSVRTIERVRLRDPKFREIVEKGHAEGRRSLRRALWGAALQCGNMRAPRGASGIAIFLAKQPLHQGGLGMSDRLSAEVDVPQLGDEDSARAELGDKLARLSARRAKSTKAAPPAA